MNTGNVIFGTQGAALLIAVTLAGAMPAGALTLALPEPAAAITQVQEPAGSDIFAVGPWLQSGMQIRSAEGPRDVISYRITGRDLSTLQILAPLRDQLRSDGFAVLYECEAVACGGFDFRFGLNILPEPDMHVDIGDFRYLSAERSGPAGPEVIGIVVSRSSNAGFVQVSRVGGTLPPAGVNVSTKSTLLPPTPVPAPTPELTPPPEVVATAAVSVAASDMASRLETGGAMPLDDLVFGSGADALEDRDYASLAALADYLRANPERKLTFVGHTDASGGLDGNVSLSRRRAESVRLRMIETYNIGGARLDAQGVGYLSPRATNLTDQGRAQNRRVEVMLTATE